MYVVVCSGLSLIHSLSLHGNESMKQPSAVGQAQLTYKCMLAVRRRFDSHPNYASYSLLSSEVFFRKLRHFQSYGWKKAAIPNEAHFLSK